jgi:DNA modification methylase
MHGDKFWLSSLEACCFARTSGSYFAPRHASPRFTGKRSKNVWHTTEKPTWLFARILRASCPPDGSVLDSCAGGGTTLFVAARLGFSAVGVELNRASCDDIVTRLSQRAFDFEDLETGDETT